MYDHKCEIGSIVDIFKTYYKFLQMFGMYKYEQDSIVMQCANHSIFSHDLYERKCLYKKILVWDYTKINYMYPMCPVLCVCD